MRVNVYFITLFISAKDIDIVFHVKMEAVSIIVIIIETDNDINIVITSLIAVAVCR